MEILQYKWVVLCWWPELLWPHCHHMDIHSMEPTLQRLSANVWQLSRCPLTPSCSFTGLKCPEAQAKLLFPLPASPECCGSQITLVPAFSCWDLLEFSITRAVDSSGANRLFWSCPQPFQWSSQYCPFSIFSTCSSVETLICPSNFHIFSTTKPSEFSSPGCECSWFFLPWNLWNTWEMFFSPLHQWNIECRGWRLD